MIEKGQGGDHGYIPISRRIFDHRFWKKPREFSDFEAWVDMIQSAAWAPHEKAIGSQLIHLDRGEVLVSLRYLAERWRWSLKRVRRWVDGCLKAGEIRAQRETQKGQIYLLVNYSHYNPEGHSESAGKGTRGAQPGHSWGTAGAQRRIKGRKEEGKEEPPTGVQGVELPPELDNPEGREAVELWLSYKKERHEAYKPIGLRELVRELAGMGGARALAAVRHSMAKNWAGVFEPTKNGATGRHPPRAPGQSDENLKSAEDIQAMLGDW